MQPDYDQCSFASCATVGTIVKIENNFTDNYEYGVKLNPYMKVSNMNKIKATGEQTSA